MTKEEKIKDLGFLKEMKDNIDKMANSFNLTNIQYVQTMINDWIDELEEEEPNNGWKSIKEDLPKQTGYYIMYNGKNMVLIELNDTTDTLTLREQFIKDGFTHYQPIFKPKPPIY